MENLNKNSRRLLNNSLVACLLIIYSTLLNEGQCLLIETELGTSKSIDVTLDPAYKLLPSLEKCGFTSSSATNNRLKRVVGGTPTLHYKHPWMAQLYATNSTTGETSINCGSTIIREDVILTAAHCLSRIATGMSFMTVAFGQSDRSKIKFCNWEMEKEEKCSKRFSRRVKKFIIHEEYSEGNLANDIGLVFLDKPVRFSSRIRPICLPYSEELLKNWGSTKLRVVGWGLMAKLDETPHLLATNLMSVDVHVRKRSYCDQFHTRQYGKLNGKRFCAGGESNSGSCSGDSGGPLLKKLQVPSMVEEEGSSNERIFQFGIVSSGVPDRCGYQGLPLVYTNVLYYMPWIIRKLATNYSSIDSVESSFPTTTDNILASSSSSEEKETIPDQINSQTVVKYENELSTGLDIDIRSHPNLHKLPKLSECGNIPPPPKNVKDSQDFDEDVDVDYDDDDKDVGHHNLRHHHKRKRKHGGRRHRRMVGGRVAGFGWFPFLAQIYQRDVMTDETELRCGGMIISKTLILTAATCVTGLSSPWAIDSVYVGNYNRMKEEECLDTECFTGKPYSIKEIIIHESFTKFAHENDIALLRIAGKLEYTRLVQPICLPRAESILNDLNDFVMISAGYGQVNDDSGEDNKPSNIPKYIEVNLTNRSFCERVYKRFISGLDRSRLCGDGEEADEGECRADLGGPLLKPIPWGKNSKGKEINKYFQFGIISFNECGKEGMPTVYSNIMYHLPWILDHI